MGEISEAQKETVRDLMASWHDALRKEGINETLLAKKLKRELNAKETKCFKTTDKDGTSDVLYSKPLIAWDIRQKARMDAQKLLSLYPVEKVDHSGTVNVALQLSPQDREALTLLADKLVDAILTEHCKRIADDSAGS